MRSYGDATVSVVLALVAIALLVLFLVYQHRIEEWLRPFADWMHECVRSLSPFNHPFFAVSYPSRC